MAERKRRLASEINVVPYIDVMLVLLIIFMVTAPLLTQGIEVDLPDVNTEPMPLAAEPVTLSIDARGRFYLDIGSAQEKSLTDDEVVRRVRAVMNNRPNQMVLIKGDESVDYGRVSAGMGLLQEAGARKIGFLTNPAPRTPER